MPNVAWTGITEAMLLLHVAVLAALLETPWYRPRREFAGDAWHVPSPTTIDAAVKLGRSCWDASKRHQHFSARSKYRKNLTA